ncbi:MAG: hypothetical protein LC749_07995, partial [Actinobacteria bacterium]|nr:hypothetical protein [Actinomycetota bacterium]
EDPLEHPQGVARVETGNGDDHPAILGPERCRRRRCSGLGRRRRYLPRDSEQFSLGLGIASDTGVSRRRANRRR